MVHGSQPGKYGRASCGQAGAEYQANREMLEPLARLAVDVLAVAALLSRRWRAPEPTSRDQQR